MEQLTKEENHLAGDKLTDDEKDSLYHLIMEEIEWLEDEDYDDPTITSIANDWRKLIDKLNLSPN